MPNSNSSIGKNGSIQATLPKFGSVLERNQQFAELTNKFGIEMFCCFRHRNENYEEVRILHITKDDDFACDEMSKVIQHVESIGFEVKPRWYPQPHVHKDWVDADVLFLGCDIATLHQAHDIIGEVRRGLLGIVTEWDLLWYFIDNSIPDASSAHTSQGGMSSGRMFSTDGICLVDAHIRRRHDKIAKEGLIVDLSKRIEAGIVRIVGPGPPRSDFHEKANRLKEKIGTNGRDQELLFATIEFMKSIRNWHAHPYDPEPKTKLRSAYTKFKNIAQKHGFPVPLPLRDIHDSDEEEDHYYRKLLTVLTGMVDVWLREYE